MLNNATELGRRLGATGIEIVEEMVSDLDPEEDGVLTFDDVKALLDRLRVRVTDDIIKELCRQYPCDSDVVLRKVRRRRTSKKVFSSNKRSKTFKRGRNNNNDFSSSNDDSSVDGSEEDDDDMYSTGRQRKCAEDSSDDEKENKSSVSKRFDSISEYALRYGLDLKQFLGDMKLGRNLRTFSRSVRSHISRVPNDRQHDGEVAEAKDLEEQFQIRRELLVVEMPANTTVASMLYLRKSVVNKRDSLGRTGVFLASALGHRELLSILLRNGGNVATTSTDGRSPLSVARDFAISSILQSSLVQVLRSCKANNADVTLTTEDMSTLPHEFKPTKFFNSLSTATFIQKKPSPNAHLSSLHIQLEQLEKQHWADSKPPLSWAISAGLVDAVAYLLNNGADPNKPDKLGRRPLHECINLVMDDMNTNFINIAPPIAELLLSAGASPTVCSTSSRTLLHELFHQTKEISIASDLNTSIKNLRTSQNVSDTMSVPALGTSHRFSSSMERQRNDIKRILVRTLLHWGAKVQSIDRDGYSALHYCCRSDSGLGCLVDLLRHGADPYQRTRLGRTALHVACQHGAYYTANFLSRWDVDIQDQSKSLLFLKDKKGKTPAMLLLTAGSSNCLDTVWSTCRAGQESKYDCFDNHRTHASLECFCDS